MAALLYRWTEADSMDLLVNDYVYLYEALTAKPVDSIRIFDWMDKNRAKMRGYNGYFLLSEVGLYFFNKILFQTGDIARADSVLRLTIPVVNRLAEPLTGKKIVYRCAQEHPLPASGVYYFFDDFTVNTYSAFFMMDRSCGTWTLNKGILTLDWGGKQIQYTETDSVFVCKEKGRNLLKLSLN